MDIEAIIDNYDKAYTKTLKRILFILLGKMYGFIYSSNIYK